MLGLEKRQDKAAVRRTLAGDRNAFEPLVKRYSGVAYSVAFARLRNAADAEDAAQEAFVRAFRHLDTLDDPSKFGSWIVGITRNVGVDMLRRREREGRWTTGDWVDMVDSRGEIEQRELRLLLRQQILDLSEEHREVLTLHYFAQKSTQQIAELLGQPREAVKKRLQRARAALGERMAGQIDLAFESSRSRESDLAKKVMAAILVAPVAWKAGAAGAVATAGTAGGLGWLAGIAGAVKATAIATVVVIAGGLSWWGASQLREPNAGNSAASASEGSGVREEAQAAGPAASPPSSAKQSEASSSDSGPATASLHGPTTLRGVVLANGVPVPEAIVRIEYIDWKKTAWPPETPCIRETATNPAGCFEMAHVPSSNCFILASKGDSAGYAWWNGVDNDIQVNTEAAGTITGTVTDASGSPVTGAWIFPDRCSAAPKELWSNYALGLRTRTRADGSFAMTCLERGDWMVSVKAKGFATLSTDFLPMGAPARLTLHQGGAATGLVLRADTRAPLAGVTLTMPGLCRWDHFWAESDSDGRYEIAGLRPGQYMVSSLDAEYVSVDSWQGVEIRDGQTAEAPVIEVLPGGNIEGRVFDADTGAGVAGVELIAEVPPVGVLGPVTTDAAGTYSLRALEQHNYTLSVTKTPGYKAAPAQARRRITVSPMDRFQGVDFALHRCRPIAGMVRNAAGAPAAAEVEAVCVSGRFDPERTRANELGVFALDGFPSEETVRVRACLDEHTSGWFGPLTAPDGGINDLQLTLAPSTRIEGRVVDARNRPLEGWQVKAVSLGERELSHGPVETGSGGRFMLPYLPEGEAAVLVAPPRTAFRGNEEYLRVRLSRGKALQNLLIVYDSGLTISGNAVGNARSGVPMLVECSGPTPSSTYTDPNGDYTLMGLEDGLYTIKVSYQTCCTAVRENVPAGSTGVDFRMLTRGRLSGRVVRSDTGASVRRFEVVAVPGHAAHLPPTSNANLISVDNPAGEFAIEWVESGENTVFVRAQGFAVTAFRVADVPPGEHVGGVEIALEPGMTVSGRVSDASGLPVAGAGLFLNVLPGPDELEAAALAHSDATGRFAIDCVPSTGATLFATAEGFAPGTANLLPGTPREVLLVLAKAAALEGTVRLAGQPIPGQTVRLRAAAGGVVPPSRTTSLTGSYRYPDLAPGEVIVEASLWETGDESLRTRRLRRTLLLEAAKVAVADFDFPAGEAIVEGTVTLDGAPAADYLVRLRVATAHGEEDIHVNTLPDGAFIAVEAPAGHATLTVRAFDAAGRECTTHMPFDIAEGRHIVEDVALTSNGS